MKDNLESHERGSVKRIMFPLFVLLISSIVTLAVLEAMTRIFFTMKLDYQIEMSRYAALMKRQVDHLGPSHAHRPGQAAHLMGVDVKINEDGFRDREYPIEKPKDSFRILMLGDSLTFGWGVEVDDCFSNIIERRLNENLAGKSVRQVEVINTGIGNFNTVQEVNFYLTRGRQWQPDLVVLNYFINDAEPIPTRRLPNFVQYSYFTMWLWGRMDILKRKMDMGYTYSEYYTRLYAEDAPAWKDTRKAFGRLKDAVQADGVDVVVFLLPELHAVGPKYGFAEIHERVAAAARRAGIAHVADLAGLFSEVEHPETLWVSADDAHPNAMAHTILAEGMLDYMNRTGIVP